MSTLRTLENSSAVRGFTLRQCERWIPTTERQQKGLESRGFLACQVCWLTLPQTKSSKPGRVELFKGRGVRVRRSQNLLQEPRGWKTASKTKANKDAMPLNSNSFVGNCEWFDCNKPVWTRVSQTNFTSINWIVWIGPLGTYVLEDVALLIPTHLHSIEPFSAGHAPNLYYKMQTLPGPKPHVEQP